MSRKTTARRGAAAVVATAVLAPGFALGIAQAAITPTPKITGLSPAVVSVPEDPDAGGSLTAADVVRTVVLSGSGFSNASEVAASGAVVASFFVVNDRKIVVEVKGISAAAVSHFTVTSSDGTKVSANTAKDDYNVQAVPTDAGTNADVTAGPSIGGTKVVLTGVDLLGTNKVTVGEFTARITKVTGTSVAFTTPPGFPGAQSVKVYSPSTPAAGVAVATFTYTTSVSRIVPAVAGSDGGDVVTVFGAGFPTGAEVLGDVKVNGVNVPVADYTVISASELVLKVPSATTAGATPGQAVAVQVSGSDTVAKTTKFTYAPAPYATLDKAHVAALATDQVLTLTGGNLSGARVTVDGTAASLISNTGSVMKVKLPSKAAGRRTLMISTTKGTQAHDLYFEAVPTVSKADLNAANTVLTVTGTGLGSLSKVELTGDGGTTWTEVPTAGYSVSGPANGTSTTVTFSSAIATRVEQVRFTNVKGVQASGAAVTVARTLTGSTYDGSTATKLVTVSGTNLAHALASDVTLKLSDGTPITGFTKDATSTATSLKLVLGAAVAHGKTVIVQVAGAPDSVAFSTPVPTLSSATYNGVPTVKTVTIAGTNLGNVAAADVTISGGVTGFTKDATSTATSLVLNLTGAPAAGTYTVTVTGAAGSVTFTVA